MPTDQNGLARVSGFGQEVLCQFAMFLVGELRIDRQVQGVGEGRDCFHWSIAVRGGVRGENELWRIKPGREETRQSRRPLIAARIEVRVGFAAGFFGVAHEQDLFRSTPLECASNRQAQGGQQESAAAGHGFRF